MTENPLLLPASTFTSEHRDRLVLRARAGRPLTPDDVVDVMRRVELTPQVLEEVHEFLDEKEIPFDDDPVQLEPSVRRIGRNRGKDASRIAMSAVAKASGSSDPVRMYLKEIGNVPLLTASEEVDLAQRIKEGAAAADETAHLIAAGTWATMNRDEQRSVRRRVADGEKARRELTSANLRLVVSIAKRYVGRSVPMLDLIQEGNLGPDASGREVRSHEGFQVLDVRHVVDPAGDHPSHRRSVADDPCPGAHGRVDQQGRAGAAGDDAAARA